MSSIPADVAALSEVLLNEPSFFKEHPEIVGSTVAEADEPLGLQSRYAVLATSWAWAVGESF